MKYVFFGTPHFAAVVLEKLLEAGMPPVAVVCNPDRPVGRKKVITAPETKRLIEGSGVRGQVVILQPEKLDVATEAKLRSLDADFFLVAAYAKIIPQAVIDIPQKAVVGVHPSLLPKYRGSSPIQTALLEGESETGVSCYLIDQKVDHGPIIAQKHLYIEPLDNYTSLEVRLAELAGTLLLEALPPYLDGSLEPKPQDETMVTFTKKFTTEDGFVEPNDLKFAENGDHSFALRIFNTIRALNPEPGVWTKTPEGKRLKLLEVELNGAHLVLKKIQKEGGRPQSL